TPLLAVPLRTLWRRRRPSALVCPRRVRMSGQGENVIPLFAGRTGTEPVRGAPPPFAELAAATNFSFLRGASAGQDMVLAALLQGYAGIGIADRNTLAGVVRAWSAL